MNFLLRNSSKMKELEYALMTTECTGLARLPVHVVRLVATDGEQSAWFLIPRPSQHRSAFGDSISVRLNFYKKGMPYYLCAEGSAEIITDVESVPATEALQFIRTMIWKGTEAAIKVSITNAEIFGEPVKTKVPPARGIGGTIAAVYAWLFAPVFSA